MVHIKGRECRNMESVFEEKSRVSLMIRYVNSPFPRTLRAILQLSRRLLSAAIPLGLAVFLTACATQTVSQPESISAPVAPPPLPAAPPPPLPAIPETRSAPSSTVRASYQGSGTAGHSTANGEHYNPNSLTAASRTLPIGSTVKVTNPDTGRSVKVRINDRGPFVHGRSLDLSKRAAQKIGLTHKGAGRVKVTRVSSHPVADEAESSSPAVTPASKTDTQQNPPTP
jgi:rare lipoprotein A